MSSARRSSGRLLTGTLVVFLVSYFCAPSTARAGCDYPAPVQHEAHKADQPLQQPATPAPCHGPFCSGRPAHAPMNVPPAPTVSPESWALLDVAVPRTALPAGISIRQTEVSSPIHRATDIFHPPR